MRIELLTAVFCFICTSYAFPETDSEIARDNNVRGMEYLEQGDPASAEKFFREAVSLDPDESLYYNNLGASLIRQRKYSAASEFLMAAVEIDPEYVRALVNLAVANFYMYNFRESYSYYRRASSVDRDYTESRLNRTRALPRVQELSYENPENPDLKRIKKYLERNE